MSFTTPPVSSPRPSSATAASTSAETSLAASPAAAPAHRAPRRNQSDPSLSDMSLGARSTPSSASASLAHRSPALAGSVAEQNFAPESASPNQPAGSGSLLSLPDGELENIFSHLDIADRVVLTEVSHRAASLARKVFTQEEVARAKINVLMNGIIAKKPKFSAGADASTIDTSFVQNYITNALKKGKAADIDITPLLKAPASDISQEQRRAEKAVLFSMAAVDAINDSTHLESVRARVCTGVTLSSGAIIKTVDKLNFLTGAEPANETGELTRSRSNLHTVSLGKPRIDGCFLQALHLHEMRRNNNIRTLDLDMHHENISPCFRNLPQPGPSALAAGLKELSVPSDTVRDCAFVSHDYGEVNVEPRNGLDPRLLYLTFRPDNPPALYSSSNVNNFATAVAQLINVNRINVTGSQNPRRHFDRDILAEAANIFLRAPSMETLTTPPLVVGNPLQYNVAVQNLLSQGQRHPHLKEIEIGDDRYSRPEAKSDVVFDRV
jgi:hypothetical protein